MQKSNRGYVVYPNEFSRRREKLELPNQVLYTPQQYKKLDDALEGGALITGEIYEYEKKTNTEKTLNNNDDTPIDIKSVLVKLHHYNARTKKRTTISVYAKDENIVFEMLRAIFPLENDRYLLNPIQAGASIALVTPLDDAEANDFYMRLLNDKFQVRLLSGNDFIKGNPTILESLRNISSRFISYETAREVKENPPFVISAATDIQAEAQEHEEYLTTENEYLKNFSS
ncbi:MAG TPA: hypothetical protein PLY93_09785, partial [Turneriella sp.]|nr:hypothetical protein [Turneriella sp.]